VSHLRRDDLLTATRLASLVSGLVALTALVVRLVAASDARDWLGFSFPGLPSDLGEAASVFLTNLQLLAAVLTACLVAQLVGPAGAERAPERLARRCIVGVCDCVLVAGCAFHVVFVGSALGAYGSRTLGALLPHGPVELAAFSLALALYIAARRERLAAQRIVRTGAASVLVLALAALLEVLAQ
jgi:hypothetical protein